MDPKIEAAHTLILTKTPWLQRRKARAVAEAADAAILPGEVVEAVGCAGLTPMVVLTDRRVLSVWGRSTRAVSLSGLTQVREREGKSVKAKGAGGRVDLVRDGGMPRELWIGSEIARAVGRAEV